MLYGIVAAHVGVKAHRGRNDPASDRLMCRCLLDSTVPPSPPSGVSRARAAWDDWVERAVVARVEIARMVPRVGWGLVARSSR